jgi:hypothetical protein
MPIKKKKIVKRKITTKKVKKTSAGVKKFRSSGVGRSKKKEKESSADIIFDSRMGDTDALFVDEPKPVIENDNLAPLDSVIEEALEDSNDSVIKNKPAEREPKQDGFWQKIAKIFKKS